MQTWHDQEVATVTTKADIKHTVAELGVETTDSIIVHTALSKFGFIPGGEASVVAALKESVGSGDIVMAAQTTDLSDPGAWQFPPATKSAVEKIRESMPPFSKETSPIHLLGKTPEYFRQLPDTLRSSHPLYSLCAWGRHAAQIVADQPFDFPFGYGSPLDHLYQLAGKVVLLGTDYESCTTLHFAESTIGRSVETECARVAVNGDAVWQDFKTVDLETYDDFNELGAQFEQAQPEAVQKKTLNGAEVSVIQIRELVDFARIYYRHKDNQVK